jgi:hypothetical protein
MFGEKVNEGAHTRRQGPAAPEENGVDVFPVAGVEFLEYRHEPAGLDVGTDMKLR